jgi:cytochrome c-type biogenesis protein CcmH/NrfG
MLFKLLTLPVTGPLDTVLWVGKKLQEAAERELNDVEEIKRQLTKLERAFDAGEISEEDFERDELVLVNRMTAAIKAKAQAKAKAGGS